MDGKEFDELVEKVKNETGMDPYRQLMSIKMPKKDNHNINKYLQMRSNNNEHEIESDNTKGSSLFQFG